MRCENCKHEKGIVADEGEQHMLCARFPKWVEVFDTHYCFEYEEKQ